MIKLYENADPSYYLILSPPPLLTENNDFLICEQEGTPHDITIEGRIYRYEGSYDIETQMSSIISEYEEFLKRPLSRADRITKMSGFTSKFTDSFDNCYLKEFWASRDLLQTINSSLYTDINTMVSVGKKDEILISCMKDLSDWITNYIGGDYSNFSTFGLGADTLDYVKNIVNFFKPYRARVLTLDSGYVIHNKLFDSITIEDSMLGPNCEMFFVDFDTADSIPGFKDESYNISRWIYSRPPDDTCRQIEDLYVDSSGRVKCIYKEVPATNVTRNITSTPPIGSYRITDIHLTFEEDSNVPMLHVVYDDSTASIGEISTFIPSDPEIGFIVLGMHFNGLSQCVIEYDSSHKMTYNGERDYYSRSHMDQGSLFDMGSSTDWETGVCKKYDSTSMDFYVSIHQTDVRIVDHIIERYNNHPSDSTSYTYFEYDYDGIMGEVTGVRTNGGFTNFDEGWCFDSAFNNDICQITITEIT
jgi:hypothetical protein